MVVIKASFLSHGLENYVLSINRIVTAGVIALFIWLTAVNMHYF
jgi:hypothetical protein